MQLIDQTMSMLVNISATNESVMDLLYRLNLQRRGVMKNVVRSRSDDAMIRIESGFDTQWDFIKSKLNFPDE